MLRPPPRPPLFPYTTLFRSYSRQDPMGARRRGRADRRYPEADCAPGGGGGRATSHGEGTGGADQVGSRASGGGDRKSTRLNSSHITISYAVFCLKKKKYTMQ